MMGGWGPHLRSLLFTQKGGEWFAAETGNDLHKNTRMIYYQKVGEEWKEKGSVDLHRGIQQNMASVTDGRMILSYGVNIVDHWIMECWFDTEKPGEHLNTCNAVTTNGKPLLIPENSNYIGAAYQKNTRIAWWTTVGKGNKPGIFSYIYNFGGGWNGPVNSQLQDSVDVGYLHSQFDSKGNLRALGELYSGDYPHGRYHAGVATIELGKQVQWTDIEGAKSPTDFWFDKISGAAHVLATSDEGVRYYFAKESDWPNFGKSKFLFQSSYRMRFGATTTSVFLVHDNVLSDKLVIYPELALSEPIKWAETRSLLIDRPAGNGKSFLGALWTVDPAKGELLPQKLSFAVNGSYPDQDHKIWYYNQK